MSYEKFEKIFEVDGIPITLFEIEEWWDNAGYHDKLNLKNPDTGDAARLAIANIIVSIMKKKNNKQQIDIISRFKKHEKEIKETIGFSLGRNSRNRLGHDAIFRQADRDDNDFFGIPHQPEVSPSVYVWPTAKELPPIPSGDIFRQALRMAEMKARAEWEAKNRPQYNKPPNTPPPKPPELPPVPVFDWKAILGITGSITKEEINRLFREKAMIMHPDHGGKQEDMRNLITARDMALKEIS